MNILIIIPAHNEERSIANIVNQVLAQGYPVLVINDGSIDKTGELARLAGADVIDIKEKSGKGNALRQGFTEAIKRNVDAVICLDGDGQHDPLEIPLFISQWQKSKAGIVNGDRMNNTKGMPWLRFLTNRFMSWIISMFCRQPIADTQCGYRLIDIQVLRSIELISNDFEVETEMLIESSRRCFKIDAVAVKTIYRDEKSKINPFKDTLRFLAYMIRHVNR